MNDKKITIKRDETGATPIYYCINKGEFFYSDNVGLLMKKSGIKPKLDRDAIAEMALIAPGRRLGSATFSNIKELPPGYKAEFNGDKLKIERYWFPTAKPHNESFEETTLHTRELLTKSVRRCLEEGGKREDKCLFLSGGLDSSIIGAIMKEEGIKIKSFSIDHEGNDKSFKGGKFQPTEDAPFVDEMSRFLDSSHDRLVIKADDLANSLGDAVIARSLPSMADVDSSLYLFCKEVSKSYRFALGGECSDELFGGYRWYYDEELLNNDRQLPWMQCAAERAGLLREGILKGIDPVEYVQGIRDEITRDIPCLESDDNLSIKRRKLFYLNYYGFMQTLGERNYSMANANKLRILSPFSDKDVAEYAFNIPWEMKFYGGNEKGLLRYAFKDILPDSIVNRKKSPFPKTYNKEYTSLVMNKLSDIISSPDCRITEIYDKKKLLELIKSEGKSFAGGKNWFGQLMSIPQIFGFLIQLEYLFKNYDVFIEL